MAEREQVDVHEITREEILEHREHCDPFILVDVMPHENFINIHLPGAINVPLNQLQRLAPMLFGMQDEIIVYCASFECTLSVTAARILARLGYPYVFDYSGGITDWIDGHQPVMISDEMREHIRTHARQAQAETTSRPAQKEGD